MIELETPYLLGIRYTFSISLKSGGDLILIYARQDLTYNVIDWHSSHGYDAIRICTYEKRDGEREKKEQEMRELKSGTEGRGREKESSNRLKLPHPQFA